MLNVHNVSQHWSTLVQFLSTPPTVSMKNVLLMSSQVEQHTRSWMQMLLPKEPIWYRDTQVGQRRHDKN
eukprot:1159086-Pelagomonas_calceolata.AAC.8